MTTTIEVEQAVLERLIAYVRQNSTYPFGPPIEDVHLIKDGIFDSFGMIELLDFVEKEFKLNIETVDLLEGRLETVRSIAALVSDRTRQTS